MNIGKVEENVQSLSDSLSRDTFIYELLTAYGLPKASITRLQQGSYNLSKVAGEIIWKKKLYYRAVFDQDLHGFIDTRRRDEGLLKHAPRFLIVTDFKTFLAYDTKTNDTLDIPLSDLSRHFDFFLPWAGLEKAQAKLENPADVKAAEKMAKLYDHIRQDNPDRYQDAASLHELNVFLSRLLFCYFAEDTEIFPQKLFTNSVTAHTQADGSDLDSYLDRLFDVLNAPEPTTPRLDHLGTMFEPLNKDARASFPEFLQKFPYVNGGLFAQKLAAPKFSARARKMLIECGSQLNWADINPDIFGSMIQAVVHPDQRGGMGMHYTSVTNIMKVIEPLLLNELREQFEKHYDDARKLQRLIDRLRHIRIFDPACGSGNFLIIAYKELRKLEIEIFQRLQEVSEQKTLPMSGIALSQLFGIELDDFAHEIAILSLWLAEHQMNVAFKKVFGRARPSLPLKEAGKVVCANALSIDWSDVCPRLSDAETIILGNPPYLGARNQNEVQKEDTRRIFDGHDDYKDSDYVANWILLASKYISNTSGRFSFVTTSSVAQGEQVSFIWSRVFADGNEIFFSHDAFKWSNNAKANAGVVCVVFGVRPLSDNPRYIYTADNSVRLVDNISPYLRAGRNIFVRGVSSPLSALPKMVLGSMPRDGGHLILSAEERRELLDSHPEARDLIRRLYGSEEFIQGKERWCLWIEDRQLPLATSIPSIKRRIDLVRKFRQDSKAKTTNSYATIPHKFAQRCLQESSAIIVPANSSEKRDYIPIGYLDTGAVITNLANAVYGVEPYIFGLLTSKMHNVWTKVVGGYIGTSIRYSIAICYNTFPLPQLSQRNKEIIQSHVFNILEVRESHPEKTMAEMYDRGSMPDDLRRAHNELDAAVERCYRAKPFASDEERLEFLFNQYEAMAAVIEPEVAHA
ncbi:type II restriction enzyme methylase subunit YeeA [Rhizobium phaseoli]|uniref:DNA methyltransferase n=1 Tax=Rhizobium phaseoli TaxID=396 RepID=UPI0007EA046C|nr:DNA methyltransferase [Rhizobium phaseoli]ANL28602.1 type II restriction enzyme methylase subunit YeeA [Rhizobium phaseoli]